ncbi:MAG: Fe3+/spermidine/putrescine ABC transporter ATP-binding protein [Methylobacterium sp.]|nr:MAG: Fe3+/spermidine/putrescine ABC transporter ATP-binding protein [Methylobacterium sp.]
MQSSTPQPAPASQPLTLDAVSHSYGDAVAVDQVTLEVRAGELVALLGPSGCGKSTLLRIVAGFINQTSGRVIIGDRVVDPLPPNRREVGIVFQNYALFPHMTVADNIAYGLEARGASKATCRERVKEMLATVRMEGFGDRKPRQLSGGQQQRVALARALAVRPRILLLDEPFAALDKNLRLDMQIEIKRLQRQFGLTAIMVTHDQDEAMSIADRIAVMSRGKIEQLGSPVAIYDEPETLFVNDFIGSSNRFAGSVETAEGDGYGVRLAGGTLWQVPSRKRFATGEPVLVTIRPEQLTLSPQPMPGTMPVRLKLSLPIGGELIHDVETSAGEAFKVAAPRRPGAPLDLTTTLHCGLAAHARPVLFPRPAA